MQQVVELSMPVSQALAAKVLSPLEAVELQEFLDLWRSTPQHQTYQLSVTQELRMLLQRYQLYHAKISKTLH